MAKKESLKLDAFDLDDELDFGDFSFGDIEGQASPDSKKKDRSPVMDVFKGTIKGAKSQLKDPSFITKVVKGALPDRYGQIFSYADEGISTTSSLYDEAIRELKPQMSRLGNKVDKLVPEEQKFLKKITKKIKGIVGEEETTAYRGVSKEAKREESISASLAAVFDNQNKINREIDIKETAKTDITRAIEGKRFNLEFKVLSSMNDGITRLATYNDKVTQAYQKKSLELQFRSYFVQSELLDTTNKFFEVFKTQNEAITKNTALPEFVKIKNSERFREIAKGKFFGNVYGGLFGDQGLGKNLIKNLKKQGSDFIKGAKYQMEQGISAIEMGESAADMMSSMGGQSKAEMAGELLGKNIADMSKKSLSKLLAKGYSKVGSPGAEKVDKLAYNVLEGIENLEGLVSKAKKSKFVSEGWLDANPIKATASMVVGSLLDAVSGSKVDTSIQGPGGLGSLASPEAVFDKRVYRSVTEVIPGYLARIHREMTSLRTGNPSTEITQFDFNTGKFKTEKALTDDIKKTISKKFEKSAFGLQSQWTTEDLLSGIETNVKQKKKVHKFLSAISREDMTYDPGSIKDSQLFKALDKSTAKIVSKALDKNITGATDKDKAQLEFTRGVKGMKGATPDIRAEIELFIKAGLGENLEKLNLVEQQSNGSYKINMDEYYRLLAKHSGKGLSDKELKEAIKDFDPKKALDAVRNTKIYSWLYKGSAKGTEPHTGPMAQDVNKTMGEKAAPGGKKLDLVNMNGINMAAIQELLKKHEDLKKETMDKFEEFKSSFTKSKEETEEPKAKSKRPIEVELASKGFKMGKEVSSKVLGYLATKAGETALTFVDVTRDALFGTSLKAIKNVTGDLSKIGKVIAGIVSPPIDMYLKGQTTTTPVMKASLIKAGFYIDQKTGKVIESFRDIKGTVIDSSGNTILTEEELAGGLIDKDGNEIKTLAQKTAQNMLTGAARRAGKVVSASKWLGKKLTARYRPQEEEEKKETGKKPAFNDSDGDGQREGGWKERLKTKAAERKAHGVKTKEADLKAKYKGGNIFDDILGKLSGFIGFLTSGFGGILGKAGEFLGGLGGIGKMLPGGLGKVVGKLGDVAKGTTGLITKVGEPLAKGVNAMKNTAAIGRIASIANTARTALMVGGLATGGFGGAAIGALGALMTGIGAIISSPVALGVGALAAAGYGVYKAYKYFTRDKVSKFDQIRISQYGLELTDINKHHNHEVLQLEQYLGDGRVGYSGNTAYLLAKKIDVVELMGFFSIDKDDKERVASFLEWFNDRFKPFYLTHMTALYSVNNKAKLEDLETLKATEQVSYLNMVSYESGPYNKTASPFKDIDYLPETKSTSINLIAQLTKEFREKADRDRKDEKIPPVIPAKPSMPRIEGDKPTKLPDYGKVNTDGSLTAANGVLGSRTDDEQLLKGIAGKAPAPMGATGGTQAVNTAGGAMSSGDHAGQYMRVGSNVNMEGLNPAVLKNFKAMVQEYGELTGKSITVTSAYRSAEQQAALHAKDPKMTAPPGRSLHQFGLALDVDHKEGTGLNEMDKLGLMRKYGFTRPVGGEPWHIEPAGIQNRLDEARRDPNYATQLVEASLFKGGGGLGSIPGTKVGRDPVMARKLWEAGGNPVDPSKSASTQDASSITSKQPAEKTSGPSTSSTIFASMPTSGGGVPSQPMVTGLGGGGSYASSTQISKPLTGADSEPTSTSGMGAGTFGSAKPVKEGAAGSHGEIKSIIADAANKVGVDPTVMQVIAAQESGLNPDIKAKGSSATGLFQFINSTWKGMTSQYGAKYGLSPSSSPTDPEANALMGSQLMKISLDNLKKIKPNPTPLDGYMSHFLGTGGGPRMTAALEKSPNAPAANFASAGAVSANKSLFTDNGQPATVQGLYNKLQSNLIGKARQFGINIAGSALAQGSVAGKTGMVSDIGKPDISGPAKPGATPSLGQMVSKTPSTGTATAPTAANVPTASGISTPKAEPTPSTPSIPSAPLLSTPVTKPQDSGQGFGLGNLSGGINDMNTTLGKSLDVQTQILDTLRNILTNVNPENLNAMRDSLLKVASSGQKPNDKNPIPDAVVDIRRRSA